MGRIRSLLLAGAAWASLAATASAQSSPNLQTGQVPTAAQWNSFFAAKADFGGAGPAYGQAVTQCGMPPVTLPSFPVPIQFTVGPTGLLCVDGSAAYNPGGPMWGPDPAGVTPTHPGLVLWGTDVGLTGFLYPWRVGASGAGNVQSASGGFVAGAIVDLNHTGTPVETSVTCGTSSTTLLAALTINTHTIITPGAGYIVGNDITMANGAVLQVGSVTSGGVVSFNVITQPTSAINGTVAQSSTTGSGTGFTASFTYVSHQTQFIYIKVPASAANPIWYNIAGAAVPATAAPPSIDIAAGGEKLWAANTYLPTAGMNCIASAPTTISLSYD